VTRLRVLRYPDSRHSLRIFRTQNIRASLCHRLWTPREPLHSAHFPTSTSSIATIKAWPAPETSPDTGRHFFRHPSTPRSAQISSSPSHQPIASISVILGIAFQHIHFPQPDSPSSFPAGSRRAATSLRSTSRLYTRTHARNSVTDRLTFDHLINPNFPCILYPQPPFAGSHNPNQGCPFCCAIYPPRLPRARVARPPAQRSNSQLNPKSDV
jgi:hypothetical protein